MTVWGAALGSSNISILFHEHFASSYACLWFLLQPWIVCLASRKGDTDIWGAFHMCLSLLFSLRIKSDSCTKGFAKSLPVPHWNCHSLCRMKWQHGGNAKELCTSCYETESRHSSGGKKEQHPRAQSSRDLSLGLYIQRSLQVLLRVRPEQPRVWTKVREIWKIKISVLEGWLWEDIRTARCLH